MSLPTLLWILGALVPAFHILGAACAIHAILFARTSQGAIAWAMTLLFFPYVAVPLYLVFGRKKFHGYVEARRQGDERIDHVAQKIVASLAPHKVTLPEASKGFGVLQNLTLTPFTRGNSARLLVDGPETFDAIFEAIDNATSYLLVQFFIIHDDALGQELARRLIARCAAGVQVYLLFDEIGSITLPKSYVARLRAAGIHMRPFNTRRGWWNRFQINFRNHRKIVVADGCVAYVGGHNVGDEYMGRSKRFGHWRDTHIELRGPAVGAVELSFVQDWHWATAETLSLPVLSENPPQGDATAIVVPSGPADPIPTCPLMLLALIAAATKRVWIASPYFVPDESLEAALQLAALRGVDVRILLPDMPDHLLVYLSAFSYLENNEAVGVKFFRYNAGFLHQKVWLIDDELAAVGTANLDNRSLRLNFEITVLLADKPFAAATAAMLEQDFANADRASKDDLKNRSLLFRLGVRLARLTSPVQ